MVEPDAQPLVSILLPARDAGETLGVCLRSIVRQREAGWECVIVDDGSRDGTVEIARAFAARDGRFRVVERARAGLVAALNSGIERCRGRWIARMDADDVMHRERLAAQLTLLESDPGLAAAGCHVRMFPRSELGPGLREYERWVLSIDGPAAVRREALVECPIVHPSLVIRRKLLERFSYRDRGWPEDYDLVLRLLASGAEIGLVPRRLLLWRQHDRRLSRVDPAYRPEAFTECKAEHLCRTFLAGHGKFVLWGYGATGRALCAALERRGRRPSRIVDVHPGRLGNRVHDAAVIPPDALERVEGERLIVSVARERPRTEIRQWLDARGWVELRDFLCAA